MALLGMVAARALLFSDTHVDSDHPVVERRWRLLGVLTIFHRIESLGQFHQVCWLHSARGELGDWVIWVGLERISGSPLYVNYFTVTHARVLDEARRYAIELSKLTHLPLNAEIEADA